MALFLNPRVLYWGRTHWIFLEYFVMFFSHYRHPQHCGVFWVTSEPFPVLAAGAVLLRVKYSPRKQIFPKGNIPPKADYVLCFLLSERKCKMKQVVFYFRQYVPASSWALVFSEFHRHARSRLLPSGSFVPYEGVQRARPWRKGLGRKCVNQSEASVSESKKAIRGQWMV